MSKQNKQYNNRNRSRLFDIETHQWLLTNEPVFWECFSFFGRTFQFMHCFFHENCVEWIPLYICWLANFSKSWPTLNSRLKLLNFILKLLIILFIFHATHFSLSQFLVEKAVLSLPNWTSVHGDEYETQGSFYPPNILGVAFGPKWIEYCRFLSRIIWLG